MTLSEESCGIQWAPLNNRELWCQRLKQQHPDLKPEEVEREWHERHAQFYQDYGFVAGT